MTAAETILVVEDEFLVAMQIEAALTAEGWSVIGPAGTLPAALRLAHEAVFHCAVLDVNLRGERVDEVATVLSGRGIPFLFASGYGREELPPLFRDGADFLAKPFSDHALVQTVKKLLHLSK